MNHKNKKILAIGGVISTLIIVFLILGKSLQTNIATDHSAKISTDIPQIGGDFTLTDTDNKEFSSESLKGKPSLIYFGFTYCPDVCVTSLQKINQALKNLDQYKIDINPVFITIDPKRDTPSILKSYFKSYHHKFIPLTGTNEQIKAVADKYKVYYSIRGDESRNDYVVDHSTFIYLFDKEGNYMTHFTMDSKVQEIVEYIRVYCR